MVAKAIFFIGKEIRDACKGIKVITISYDKLNENFHYYKQ